MFIIIPTYYTMQGGAESKTRMNAHVTFKELQAKRWVTGLQLEVQERKQPWESYPLVLGGIHKKVGASGGGVQKRLRGGVKSGLKDG